MNLRNFLKEKEKEGKILHIKDQVSPRFEISSIIKAFDGGPILFFDKIKGHTTKVVANVCGTRGRFCAALNVNAEGLYQRLIDAWRSPVPPKIVEEGPVKEVVEKPKLTKIPVLTHFKKDAGPYLTSATIYARSSDRKIENVSIHRLLVLDDTHLTIRIVPRHLFKLWEMAKKERKDMEIAIALGLNPAVSLAAASSLPFGVSEFNVANTLLKNNFRLIKCENVDAYAPADAEIVLEGIMSVKKETLEGPLTDVTGTYDIKRSQPIIELVGMMHRKDSIYQALLPSGTEHKLLMGLPRETKIWETVAKVVPVVKAVNLTKGGCGWLHAIISIEKKKDGDGKNALMETFAAHPSLKHAVVVDTDINVFNPEEVEWAIATRFQADKNLIIIPNARGSTLDPSANQETGLTTKLGVDATRPLSKSRLRFERAEIPTNKKVDKIIRELRTAS
jgi:UbiD family decarboxylase